MDQIIICLARCWWVTGAVLCCTYSKLDLSDPKNLSCYSNKREKPLDIVLLKLAWTLQTWTRDSIISPPFFPASFYICGITRRCQSICLHISQLFYFNLNLTFYSDSILNFKILFFVSNPQCVTSTKLNWKYIISFKLAAS